MESSAAAASKQPPVVRKRNLEKRDPGSDAQAEVNQMED